MKITVHGELTICFLFNSWKIILLNHASRLLWKSRFTRKKLAISHFMGKKRADHQSQKYPLPPSIFNKCVSSSQDDQVKRLYKEDAFT